MKKITSVRFSEIYGVSEKTWRRWTSDSKFPGGLDPSGVFRFIGQKKSKPQNMRSPEEVAELLEEEIGKEIQLSDVSDLTGIELEKYRKIKGEADIIGHRLQVLREEVILKSDASSTIAEAVELIFQELESFDEDMAESWEGKSAVQILEGRKNERDKIRNNVTNAIEKSLG